jgi:hypothetical protein
MSTFFSCPICGYDRLDEPPYDENGNSSFDICPCCGIEFGYEDSRLINDTFIDREDPKGKYIHNWNRLQTEWKKKCKLWHFPKYKLNNWDPIKQLKNVDKFLATYKKTGKFDFRVKK